jgi:hypothetical protein
MGEALIEGTMGVLTLHGDGSVTRRDFGQASQHDVLPPVLWKGFGGDCVHALQSHVIDAMRCGTQPENIAAEYLEVIAIKDAIYASAQEGRKIALGAR